MPIEIREIVIKTTVGANEAAPKPSTQQAREDRQALIQECVDHVMDILREKAEC